MGTKNVSVEIGNKKEVGEGQVRVRGGGSEGKGGATEQVEWE